MGHPFERFEGTPLWEAIAEELIELAKNGALVLRTPPQHVVGALCERLSRSNLVNASADRSTNAMREQFVAFLDLAARGNREGWQESVSTHYADPDIEEARRQAALTGMRLERGDITEAQAAEYFSKLAGRLRE